jgi:hypothetical protein
MITFGTNQRRAEVSREEAIKALIESGMDLRQDDIELGKKLEQERIIKLLEKHNCVLDGSHHSENLCTSPHHLGLLIAPIKGEQK